MMFDEPVTSSVLQLQTINDVNGNPRRLFVRLVGDHVTAVVDSGKFSGAPEWARGRWPVTIVVPPAEYRRWAKMADKMAKEES